jgi:hypothetical protein
MRTQIYRVTDNRHTYQKLMEQPVDQHQAPWPPHAQHPPLGVAIHLGGCPIHLYQGHHEPLQQRKYKKRER